VKGEELARILPGVRAAVRDAAALVKKGYRHHPVVEHKSALELVTEYDRASELLLRERLGATFGFDVVGEEEGGKHRPEAPAFFVDPIDGTTNFVHGHPFWCVSVGLVLRGVPILGVVLAPSLGLEWYGYAGDGDGAGGGGGGAGGGGAGGGGAGGAERVAIRRAFGSALEVDAGDGGGGARGGEREREEPCRVSPMATFEDSLLATGFPYDRKTSAENNFDAFVAIKRRCQAVRRCGSAALDLCMVADGTYEGYWERKLRPWDIAGGIAVVLAAGGRVSEFEVDAAEASLGCMTTGHVVATNGHIHDALLAELARVPRPSVPPSRG